MSTGSTSNPAKRRQALQLTAFLAAVALLTVGVFHLVRADLVAYRRASDALARGDLDAARAGLEDAWVRGYRTATARLDLARLRLQTGDRTGALSLYAEALGSGTPDPQLLDAVVGLYQTAGQPDRALALHERLGPASALPAVALVRRGDILQQSGDLPAALEVYRLASQRAPDDAQVQLRLGLVLSWTGRLPEAIEALRHATTLEPGLREARLQLARVLSWHGQFADSVTEFRRVLPP